MSAAYCPDSTANEEYGARPPGPRSSTFRRLPQPRSPPSRALERGSTASSERTLMSGS